MTAAALILAAVLAAVAVVWVARPFLVDPARRGGPDEAPDEAERRRVALLEDRDRALAALKELEFDHRTGKLSDDDYRELVGPLRQDAAAALAALDRQRAGEPDPVAGGELPAEPSRPGPGQGTG